MDLECRQVDEYQHELSLEEKPALGFVAEANGFEGWAGSPPIKIDDKRSTSRRWRGPKVNVSLKSTARSKTETNRSRCCCANQRFLVQNDP
jgi:hypothetical protein